MSKITNIINKANAISAGIELSLANKAHGKLIAQAAMSRVSRPKPQSKEEAIQDITSTYSYNYWLEALERGA